MKFTKIQITTLVLIIAYFIYEFYFVKSWTDELPDNDPIIRVDLILIYPILLILILVSIYDLVKKKKYKK